VSGAIACRGNKVCEQKNDRWETLQANWNCLSYLWHANCAHLNRSTTLDNLKRCIWYWSCPQMLKQISCLNLSKFNIWFSLQSQ